MFKFFAFAGLLLALSYEQASAQQPTQAERDRHSRGLPLGFHWPICSGVQPGGKEAFRVPPSQRTPSFRRLARPP